VFLSTKSPNLLSRKIVDHARASETASSGTCPLFREWLCEAESFDSSLVGVVASSKRPNTRTPIRKIAYVIANP